MTQPDNRVPRGCSCQVYKGLLRSSTASIGTRLEPPRLENPTHVAGCSTHSLLETEPAQAKSEYLEAVRGYLQDILCVSPLALRIGKVSICWSHSSSALSGNQHHNLLHILMQAEVWSSCWGLQVQGDLGVITRKEATGFSLSYVRSVNEQVVQ